MGPFGDIFGNFVVGLVVVLVTFLRCWAAPTHELVAWCDETLHDSGVGGGRLVSQFSQHYDNGMDCIMTLRALHIAQTISIDFDWIDMETYGKGCPDYLEIYDGVNTSSKLIKRMCGNYGPHDVISTKDSITLRMVTDSTVTFGGFSLVYTTFHDGIIYPCNGTSTFLCDNQRCISSELHCDDMDNCGDISDEWSCTKVNSRWSEWLVMTIVTTTMVAIACIVLLLCALYYHCVRRCNSGNRTTRGGTRLEIQTLQDHNVKNVSYTPVFIAQTMDETDNHV